MARATGRLDHKTAVLGQEEIDMEATKNADNGENLQDMPAKTTEVIQEQRLPAPAPAFISTPQEDQRREDAADAAMEGTHQRGSSSTDTPMGLAGAEYFNMDSSPRRATRNEVQRTEIHQIHRARH